MLKRFGIWKQKEQNFFSFIDNYIFLAPVSKQTIFFKNPRLPWISNGPSLRRSPSKGQLRHVQLRVSPDKKIWVALRY